MLKTGIEYENSVITNLENIHVKRLMPDNHIRFLEKMKLDFKFEPTVIYDIGSCVLHWTNEAAIIWPNSKIYLFDAFSPVETLYKKNKYEYNIGVLSNEDDKILKFYQNDFMFSGNSYYRELPFPKIFPQDNFILKQAQTLDTVVNNRFFKYPDLIKIDVQGAELDILHGSKKCLEKCEYIVVELQDTHYNEGAPLANITIDYLKSIGFDCIARKFSDNGPDADYCFKKTK